MALVFVLLTGAVAALAGAAPASASGTLITEWGSPGVSDSQFTVVEGTATEAPAASTGASQATQARSSGACELARQRVAKAKVKLKRAEHALKQAEGATAKRKPRKQVKQANKTLAAALDHQATARRNHPPRFLIKGHYNATFENTYDGLGVLQAVTAHISIRPAFDQDGDSLTYHWTASNGSIRGSGLHATWKRVVTEGIAVPATVTVTANDGRGGTAKNRLFFDCGGPTCRPGALPLIGDGTHRGVGGDS